ncbi:MAG: dihydrolipoamide acetyltransferase family protein [Promethearchaeati archaeon SRVP18_Atabeyarchaeia-1]
MVTPLILPAFSLGMKEGTILKWYKKEKDAVEKGEVVVKVFGEKMEVDLDSPAAGLLLKVMYGENTDVPVSTVIALIGEPKEDISSYLNQLGREVAAIAPATATLGQPPRMVTPSQPSLGAMSTGLDTPRGLHDVGGVPGRVRASPAARRIAREGNLDLRMITGTGPNGRIVARNVLSFSGSGAAVSVVRPSPEASAIPSDSRKVKNVATLSHTRRVIGKRMCHSARTAPHITIIMETDMSEIVKLREKLMSEVEKRTGSKLSYTDIIVKVTAKALEEFPNVNSTLLDECTLKTFDEINVGVAIAAKDGLIVPVVHNANKLSIAEISAELSMLIDNAQKGKLSPEQMSGGTFTVTSLGMYGVDVFIPIINPPESGILAVGKITKKPVVDDKGQIVVKPMAFLALAVDHRVIDGAPAAEFLQRVKEILEDPFALRY